MANDDHDRFPLNANQSLVGLDYSGPSRGKGTKTEREWF